MKNPLAYRYRFENSNDTLLKQIGGFRLTKWVSHRRIESLLTCLFLLVLQSTCFAQQGQLVLDLGEHDPGGTYKFTEKKGTYDIVLENILPLSRYFIEIEYVEETFDPLVYTPLVLESAFTSSVPCKELTERISRVEDLLIPVLVAEEGFTERTVFERVKLLKHELETTSCNDQKTTEKAKHLLPLFLKTIQKKITIGPGKTVKIKVISGQKTWIFEIGGGSLGEWTTVYGFVFTSQFLTGRTYFSKAAENEGEYEITRAKHPRVHDLKYTPSILFTFTPKGNISTATKTKNWKWSTCAGLGFDLTAPVIVVGANAMYHQNFGIAFGVSFDRQDRLKSQYVGDSLIVSQSLDFDQLHEKTYRPNVFVSLNFRFKDNPFGSKDE